MTADVISWGLAAVFIVIAGFLVAAETAIAKVSRARTE